MATKARRSAKRPSTTDVARLYRQLYRIRRVEEEVERIYATDKIKSPVHLAIGQEAVSVAVCDVLRPTDVLGCTYRSHAAYLAKGGDLRAMMSEMFGKSTGCARGKGGSMHLVDMQHFLLGASAVVGTGIPIAAGYAVALKREGNKRIAVSMFGDGATEEGCFYETLNFAHLHKLPLLFLCENNFYSIHTHISKRWSTPNVCGRARAFGLPVQQIDDGDIFKMRAAAEAAVTRIRRGGGPEFLEVHTYRWRQHVGPGPDYEAGYRTEREAKKWIKSDQVTRLADMVQLQLRTQIEDAVNAEIADSITYAESSPFPGPEDLLADVYAD